MKKRFVSIFLVLIMVFTMVSLSINADETEKAAADQFKDVSTSDSGYDAIQFVYENKIMNGIALDEFAANNTLTRAMLVTILHRAEKEPAVKYGMSFKDIEEGQYYIDAVRWAASEGIVNGVSAEQFAPNTNITREQLAAIIYRYAKMKGYDVSLGDNINILTYEDVNSISQYAVTPIQFVLGKGIMTERDSGVIAPLADATRIEAAVAVKGVLTMEAPKINISELAGEYYDNYSGRAGLIAEFDGNDALKITVSWGNSAFETVEWTMTAKLDENSKLSYNDCTEKNYVYDQDGKETVTVISDNGSGYFSVFNGKLLWDGAADENCKNCQFEKKAADSQNNIVGVYCHAFEEEFEGSTEVFLDYLVLNSDNTGYLIIQDIVPIIWDDKKITDINNDISYDYSISGDDITLDYDDINTVYSRTGSGLPKEIQKIIDEI